MKGNTLQKGKPTGNLCLDLQASVKLTAEWRPMRQHLH